MIKYCFKDSPITIKAADKANPQRIGEALAKIAAAGGGELTPKAVVEAARSSSNVLHKHFEWDDSKAAEAFRLDQARNVIRSIHAEDEDASDGHAAAFVSVSDKGGTSYRTLDAIKNSADLQARVLAQAERDLDAFQRRYRAMQDVCAIIRTAQDALAKKRAKTENRASA
jgi:hypothetical protein